MVPTTTSAAGRGQPGGEEPGRRRAGERHDQADPGHTEPRQRPAATPCRRSRRTAGPTAGPRRARPRARSPPRPRRRPPRPARRAAGSPAPGSRRAGRSRGPEERRACQGVVVHGAPSSLHQGAHEGGAPAPADQRAPADREPRTARTRTASATGISTASPTGSKARESTTPPTRAARQRSITASTLSGTIQHQAVTARCWTVAAPPRARCWLSAVCWSLQRDGADPPFGRDPSPTGCRRGKWSTERAGPLVPPCVKLQTTSVDKLTQMLVFTPTNWLTRMLVRFPRSARADRRDPRRGLCHLSRCAGIK